VDVRRRKSQRHVARTQVPAVRRHEVDTGCFEAVEVYEGVVDFSDYTIRVGRDARAEVLLAEQEALVRYLLRADAANLAIDLDRVPVCRQLQSVDEGRREDDSRGIGLRLFRLQHGVACGRDLGA